MSLSNTWSFVATRSLVAGGYAHFYAYGPPMQLATVAFGVGTPIGLPMTSLGFASPPNCALHLTTLDGLIPAILVPDSHPALVSRGGRADFEFKLPAVPTMLGTGMTTQWLEWSQMATSNALQWTVAGAMPTPGRGGEQAMMFSQPATFAVVTVMIALAMWL